MKNPASILSTCAIVATLGHFSAINAAPVSFIPLDEEIAALNLAVKDSKGTKPLKDLSPQKRTATYNCVIGKTPLQLVALDKENSTVDISIPEEIKTPLVLILSDADAPSGLRTITVDDGSEGFSWGSLLFFNSTDKPLSLRFEKEVKAIPEGFTPVQLVPGGETRNVGVQLFSEDAPDTILYSAVWEHDPNLRKLIFIVPAAEDESRTFELKIIPQNRRVSE